jgi:SAM domain (Sterile alpha motif)
MSSREVTNWLQSHRLGAYVDVFAEHDVTWDVLGALGDEDLREMGLKTSERRRLLRAIAQSPNQMLRREPARQL